MDPIETIAIHIRIRSELGTTTDGRPVPSPASAAALASAVDSVAGAFPGLCVASVVANPSPTSLGDPAGQPPRLLGDARDVVAVDKEVARDDVAVDIDVDDYESATHIDIGVLDARVRTALNDRGSRSTVLTMYVSLEHAARCGAVLTRYQRYVRLRNEASLTKAFERVLCRHRAIHDLRKPLELADYEHALDTWKWVLRLEPKASVACQLAALFHDVERLVSESNQRIEQHASDYAAFKNAHAIRGAHIMRRLLADSALPEDAMTRAFGLVANHELMPAEADAAILADADALSFFSLNSPGFVDYYGEEHTRRKIDHTLCRMGPRAAERIAGLWLRADVRRIVEERIAIAKSMRGSNGRGGMD